MKRAGDERRRGIFAARLGFDIFHGPAFRAFHCGQEGVGIFFVADLEFVAVDFEQFCHEMFALVLLRRELGEKVPVFFRDKRLDQAFPFTDETQGDGLDAPGAQSFFDFPPEQRAYHITDDAVKHAPRLLRVHTVDVDRARCLKRLRNGGFRDFMERDAVELRFFVGFGKNLFQMPRDCLSFAVRVGRKINFGSSFCGAFQIAQVLAALLAFLILRRKIVFDVYTESAGGQVPYMPHGGFDCIIPSQHLADGLGFRGRLHYHQFLIHICQPSTFRNKIHVITFLHYLHFSNMSSGNPHAAISLHSNDF